MNIANKQLYLYIFCKCKEHRFITLTFSMTACVRRKDAPLPVKRLVLLIKLVCFFSSLTDNVKRKCLASILRLIAIEECRNIFYSTSRTYKKEKTFIKKNCQIRTRLCEENENKVGNPS